MVLGKDGSEQNSGRRASASQRHGQGCDEMAYWRTAAYG